MLEISCAIIEDNEFDRKSTEYYVEQFSFLKLAGSFSNVFEAQGILNSNTVKLLFMDIDMPVMNGLDFLKSLDYHPLCIFITAHPEYAVESFELHALDYIVKPLKLDRFRQAVNRAKEYIEIKSKAELYDVEFGKNTLSIKEGTATIQLNITDIIYLEALGDYTKIITSRKMYLTLHNLKAFIEKLPEQKFLRIHRSFAVAISKIKVIKDNELVLDDVRLPVGKTFRRTINKYLVSS